jgi:hypothetical protein
MFKPELKNTGWEIVPEVVFEITGENYQESARLYRKYYEVEKKDGSKITLSEPSLEYNTEEEKLSTMINDSLMDVVWDAMTISELETHFKNAISDWTNCQLRLELDGDLIFGWIHYNHKKKINTFRFKINIKGKFSKC